MIDVKLFNSLTNQYETLKPVKEGEVSMYCCGPTVYGDAHVGNIRPAIVFDTLSRFLSYIGYKVYFVSNFTDIDDKIINKAISEGLPESVISERYIEAYVDVLKSINVRKHYKNPRVTEYMPEIISYIDDLVKSGNAYDVNGDVFFKVSSIDDYGELSNVKIDDLIVGARIEENSKKESPLDFALWKKTENGIKWDSPFGEGRPGWHTECCVMINSIFGHKIDIHGGGFDLKFPHHENEIAQAKAHDHSKLANIWMHNGFVNFGGEKMSKSLGNVVLAKDAISQYGGPLLRLLMLSTHYRAPVQFTPDTVEGAKNEYEKIRKTYSMLAVSIQLNNGSLSKGDRKINIDNFLSALADDLNTSNAFASLYDLLKKANTDLRKNPLVINDIEDDFYALSDMFEIFGLEFKYPVLTSEDKDLYNEYLSLKKEKRFEESDVLRQKLITKGIL